MRLQRILYIVISEEIIKSSFVTDNLAFVASQGARIVPIVIGKPNIPDNICTWIGKYQQIPSNSTENDLNRVVYMLDSSMERKISNMQK